MAPKGGPWNFKIQGKGKMVNNPREPTMAGVKINEIRINPPSPDSAQANGHPKK